MQCSRQCCCWTTLGIMASSVLVLVASFFIWTSANGYPFHASCQIEWQIKSECNVVKQKIIGQMQAWNTNTSCPTVNESCPKMPCGQRCLYTYDESKTEANKIFGKHETPVKRYSDSLSFEFEQSGDVCKVKGYSSSDLWYAILDYGTNYCNIWNLVDGAGLTGKDGFVETTSDSVCTQYSSRDCSRF